MRNTSSIHIENMSLLVLTFLLYLSCIQCVQALHQFSYHVAHDSSMQNHVYHNDDHHTQRNMIHYTKPYSPESYHDLCNQPPTSRGFKIGFMLGNDFFGHQRKNCYYLCDEQLTINGHSTPQFHCCPHGYRMDFEKQLCADSEYLRNRRSQGTKNILRTQPRPNPFKEYINKIENIRKQAASKPSVRITRKRFGNTIQTSEPTIRDVGKCENLYKKHSECNKYWQCVVNRFEVEMVCPSGLYWNENRNHCDINRNVQCAKDLPTLNDIITRERDEFKWNRNKNFTITSTVTESVKSGGSKTLLNHKTTKPKWFKRIGNKVNVKGGTKGGGESIAPVMQVRCLNKWQAAFYKKKYGIDCPINHISIDEFRKGFGTRRRFWKNSTKDSTKNADGTKNKPVSTTRRPIITTSTTTIPSEASTTNIPDEQNTPTSSSTTTVPSTPSQTTDDSAGPTTTDIAANQSTEGTPVTVEPTELPTRATSTSQSTADGSGNKTELPTTTTPTPTEMPQITTQSNHPTVTTTELSPETTATPNTSTATTAPQASTITSVTNEPTTVTTTLPPKDEPIISSTNPPTSENESTDDNIRSSTTESPAVSTSTPRPEETSSPVIVDNESTTESKRHVETTITPTTIAPEIMPPTTSVSSAITIETTTPLFNGTIQENGPCLHPGQRFKDEDDCQCFYECQFNRKLVRNCCPEGLLFNQNEQIPDNNEESEGDDAVCDLPENVQCTSIIS